MTEAEWLACPEPGPLLDALDDLVSPRKRRLFVCACCRRVQAVAPHVWDPDVLDVAERFADGLATTDERYAANRQANEWLSRAWRRQEAETHARAHPASAGAAALAEAEYAALRELRNATDPVCHGPDPGRAAAHAVGGFAAAGLSHAAGEWERTDAALTAVAQEQAAQADLVRDLFTDRLWFAVPDPSWFTADVMALAQNIYDGRAFEHLPILADALQDAGCDSDAVLNHCRDGGPHARGCWVLDLILGKV